jgi:hypothetical protein
MKKLLMIIVPAFLYITAPAAAAQVMTFNLDASMPGSFGSEDTRIWMRTFDKQGKLLAEFIDFDATQKFTIDFGKAEYFIMTEHETGVETKVSIIRKPEGNHEVLLEQTHAGFNPANLEKKKK